VKLLSDFDGVWTDPSEEAASQGEVLDAALIEWASADAAPRAAAWIADARAAVAREPWRWGWAPGGRVSAFGDEDPFAPHSALLHYLHERAQADPVAAALVDGVRRHGFDALDAFGGHAHARGVERVAERRGPRLLPASVDAGRRMLDRGVEIVVVSNSGTDKLVRWFGSADLPLTVHPERTRGAIRLRGGGRKFVLDGDRRAPLELGRATIETARPHYEEALREERPDAVVGDVFSLDLALPLALKRAEPAFRALRLFFLDRAYTPAWLREAIASAAPEVEIVAGGLPGVADRLAG
jgi:hypothetical protein